MKKSLLLSIFRKTKAILAGKGLRKLPFVMTTYGLLYRYLKPTGILLIEVQNHRMYLDTRDTGVAPHLIMNGVYEEFETQVFRSMVKPGMVVLDVGANIGYYTLIAADLVGEQGRVYAFEPHPSNYDLRVRNIA